MTTSELPQGHRRHASLFIERSGDRAIVVALHYNDTGGALVEGHPTVLSPATAAAALGEALRTALASSSVGVARDLRARKQRDWPAYQASGARSVRDFEAEFITLEVSSVNDSNVTYRIEGLPGPAAELRVCAVVAAASPELGSRCLEVWQACRDRRL